MGPVPIVAEHYAQSIVPGSLGSTMAALARQERLRMLRIYERYGAYLQPVKVLQTGHLVWTVKFPTKSIFKDGPLMKGSWLALQANYERNRRFPYRDPLEKGNGLAVHNIEKYETQELEEEAKNAETAARNALFPR